MLSSEQGRQLLAALTTKQTGSCDRNPLVVCFVGNALMSRGPRIHPMQLDCPLGFLPQATHHFWTRFLEVDFRDDSVLDQILCIDGFHQRLQLLKELTNSLAVGIGRQLCNCSLRIPPDPLITY